MWENIQGLFICRLTTTRATISAVPTVSCPDECFTIVINIEELAKRIDVAGVKAALFLAGRRPETNLRFQMGPLVTIPKDGADE